MEKNLLEIREFTGAGYQPVIDFGAWRVAVLNYLDEIRPDRIEFMERHNETDEVFVLQNGQAVLFLGEGDADVEKIFPQPLQRGKIYNVKQSVWHTIVLSQDGSVLIVENQNTTQENSNYSTLRPDHRQIIQDESKKADINYT